MKIISKITKQEAGGWVGHTTDGESVSLSTWMTDNDVKTAVRSAKRSPNNIFKIKKDNRYIPLGHKLGQYSGYEGTSVVR